MQSPQPLPPQLRGRPFTTQQARELGISKDVLHGSRVRQIHRGVHCYAGTTLTPALLIAAARMLLPEDAALSHVTALQWYGVNVGESDVLHFSTNTTSQTALTGVVLHRRQGRLSPRIVQGVPLLGPDRTLVDCATQLGYVNLVRAGDWLVRLGLSDPDHMIAYAMERHMDGVRRARKIVGHVERRVDSVMETDLRLMLRFARLPSPECNGEIRDADGRFLARGDLVYYRHKVVVEYDGWHHERDARQRQKDHLRRERLEAAGWRVIVVTIEDMKKPAVIVARVHAALVKAGYVGPAPVMSDSWHRWFVK